MEVSGQLDVPAALLSWQKATEHETGLLSSGVMGICHTKHRMNSCHYRGKMRNVVISNPGYSLHTYLLHGAESFLRN